MSRFKYVCAHSLDEALRLLNEPEVKSQPLAGGTDLLVQLRRQGPWFDRVVDISAIDTLKRIELEGERIHLGAGTTFTQVIESALLQRVAPFLVEACRRVGSLQIRNLGTLGGNVINAAACADSLPPLVCLDALAHLRSPSGAREVPVSQLVLRPHQTDLRHGELLTHFSFQAVPEGVQTAFLKLGRRNAQAIARLSMAAMGRLDESGRVDYLRLTPGAATPRTLRFKDVERELLGRAPSDELLSRAAEQVAKRMIEISGRRWSTPYKEIAIRALAERALRAVVCDGSKPDDPCGRDS
jgi:carbon-monoxide dehydrogenase medium subunit/xanthine dehydrogenase FAD-binding subunit